MTLDLRTEAHANMTAVIDQLRIARRIGGIGTDQVAIALQVSLRSVELWENGDLYPSAFNFLNLARFFRRRIIITGADGECTSATAYVPAYSGWEWEELARLGATLRTLRSRRRTTHNITVDTGMAAARLRNIEAGRLTVRPLVLCTLAVYHECRLDLAPDNR